MALAPLYAVAGIGQAFEGTLECVLWSLWIRICETMDTAGLGWLMRGPAAGEGQRIGGLVGRDERYEGKVESKGMERVRMMEEGRRSHSNPS